MFNLLLPLEKENSHHLLTALISFKLEEMYEVVSEVWESEKTQFLSLSDCLWTDGPNERCCCSCVDFCFIFPKIHFASFAVISFSSLFEPNRCWWFIRGNESGDEILNILSSLFGNDIERWTKVANFFLSLLNCRLNLSKCVTREREGGWWWCTSKRLIHWISFRGESRNMTRGGKGVLRTN